MKADYIDLKRKLSILRYLSRQPADKYELAEFVECEVTADAYDGMQTSAGKKRFENDIKGLNDLGCDIQHYERQYHLESYGDFNPVGLGEEDLDALAFLQEAFASSAPRSDAIQRLLKKIADWLPDNQHSSLSLRQSRLRLNFGQQDAVNLDVRVEKAIHKALKEGRLLRFGYLSPNRTDGQIVIQTVQPWAIFYDTRNGHQYLDAFWLATRSSNGEFRPHKWQKFRPESIIADQIEVLPDKRPPLPPKRPSYPLEYWLSPRILRKGHVTRHFDQMQTHERSDAGWVRVTGTTDDLFSAVRLLLRYGDQCVVTGGSEARKEVEGLVKGMAELYGVK